MFRVSLWLAIVFVSCSAGVAACELRPNLQAALEEAKQAQQAYADKAALASIALARAPDPRVAINRTRMEIKEAEKLLQEQTKIDVEFEQIALKINCLSIYFVLSMH